MKQEIMTVTSAELSALENARKELRAVLDGKEKRP